MGGKDFLGWFEARMSYIRDHKPLVHHITNFVVMNETANVTLCVGALPVMAHAQEEVEEMVSLASALLINIGTLYPEMVESMLLAGKEANRRGIPVILDPVGVGATRYRTDTALNILNQVKVAVVRGNAGEVSTLAGYQAEVRGVESLTDREDMDKIALELAARLGCVTAITGPVDYVSDGKQVITVHNGHALLGKVTGTGCMATTVIACFCTPGEPYLEGAVAGLSYFGIAGEIAAETAGSHPGSFHVQLYDALHSLDMDTIQSRARIVLEST